MVSWWIFYDYNQSMQKFGIFHIAKFVITCRFTPFCTICFMSYSEFFNNLDKKILFFFVKFRKECKYFQIILPHGSIHNHNSNTGKKDCLIKYFHGKWNIYHEQPVAEFSTIVWTGSSERSIRFERPHWVLGAIQRSIFNMT